MHIVLTGSYDSTARLWNAATAEPIGPPLRHEKPVKTVAFSPNGDKVLTGGGDRGRGYWNVASGKQIGPPSAHGMG